MSGQPSPGPPKYSFISQILASFIFGYRASDIMGTALMTRSNGGRVGASDTSESDTESRQRRDLIKKYL